MGKEKKTESHSNGSYNYKMFKCFNRKFKINEVQPTNDVRDAFCKFSVGGGGDGDRSSGVMGAEQLCSFLDDHHVHSVTTVAEAQRLIDEVIRRRHHVTRFTRHGLDLDDFFNFLFYDDLNPPIKSHVKSLNSIIFSSRIETLLLQWMWNVVSETGASRHDSSVVSLLYIHGAQLVSYWEST